MTRLGRTNVSRKIKNVLATGVRAMLDIWSVDVQKQSEGWDRAQCAAIETHEDAATTRSGTAGPSGTRRQVAAVTFHAFVRTQTNYTKRDVRELKVRMTKQAGLGRAGNGGWVVGWG